MDLASVGAASISFSMSQVQQSASISIMKKAMDMQGVSLDAMLQSLPAAAPSFGHSLDVYA